MHVPNLKHISGSIFSKVWLSTTYSVHLLQIITQPNKPVIKDNTTTGISLVVPNLAFEPDGVVFDQGGRFAGV